MRLFNLIDSYEALNESVLTTDFSWGFELEGICTQEKSSDSYVGSYHSGGAKGTAKELEEKLDELIGAHGRLGSDVSVKPDDRGGWPFEYATGVLPFNPRECSRILKLLKDELPNLKIYTNNSCGFHCHVSYNDIDKKSAAWILCCIAIDEGLKKELTELNVNDFHVEFFNDYAEKDFYEKVKKGILEKDWSLVNKIINGIGDNEKYRNVRIHPQGTLEWRGPRNFIGMTPTILEFMKKLYKVVFTFGKIADSRKWSYEDITINKSDIDDHVNVTLSFDSKVEKTKQNKNASLAEKIKKNPTILLSLRPTQVKPLFNDMRFVENIFNDMDSDVIMELWNRWPDSVRFDYMTALKTSSDYALQTFFRKIARKEYILPERYIPLFEKFSDFMYIFESHLQGVPLTLIKDYDKFTDRDGVRKYILSHKDEIPMEGWKYLIKPEMWRLLPYLNMPVNVQRKFVKKNPYNIQYIRQPDQNIIDSLKTKIPDIEQYVARYYK